MQTEPRITGAVPLGRSCKGEESTAGSRVPSVRVQGSAAAPFDGSNPTEGFFTDPGRRSKSPYSGAPDVDLRSFGSRRILAAASACRSPYSRASEVGLGAFGSLIALATSLRLPTCSRPSAEGCSKVARLRGGCFSAATSCAMRHASASSLVAKDSC